MSIRVAQQPDQVPDANTPLCLSFNQDGSCLAVGTGSGFQVFTCSPFRLQVTRAYAGGVAVAEMLCHSNFFALVGTGRGPSPRNEVVLWNDKSLRVQGRIPCSEDVLSVRLNARNIAVATASCIRVFSHSCWEVAQLRCFPTCPNPLGLVALTPQSGAGVVAIPDAHHSARVEHLGCDAGGFTPELGPVGMIALNGDGSLLGAASQDGCSIAVYRTCDMSCVKELRCGLQTAEVYCISFSHDSTLLACSSSQGTVHLFSLEEDSGNTASVLAPLWRMLPLPYFSGEWSFTQAHGIQGPSVCVFGKADDALYVACADGTLKHFAIGPHAGDTCVKVHHLSAAAGSAATP